MIFNPCKRRKSMDLFDQLASILCMNSILILLGFHENELLFLHDFRKRLEYFLHPAIGTWQVWKIKHRKNESDGH